LQWNIEYLPDARIVRVATSGTVTFKTALAVAADLAAQLQRNAARKFLVDHRAAVVKIGIVDLYYLVDETEKAGLGRQYTGAIVFARDTDHDFAFYESRAVNAGFRRRTFIDMNAALAWLESVTDLG
jgi:hypothetical protein